MLGLKPIKLLPARERVASALRKAIISRQIQEGETLTLESTAQELGVSVTPVREAFQILARDGLIELEQNKAAVVLGVNEKTIREHYQIRAALESEACVLCCENEADLSAIKNCLDASIEAFNEGDNSNYANLNQSFHYEIWRRCLQNFGTDCLWALNPRRADTPRYPSRNTKKFMRHWRKETQKQRVKRCMIISIEAWQTC